MLKLLFNDCTVAELQLRIIFMICWSYNPQAFRPGWFDNIRGDGGNGKSGLIPQRTLTEHLLCQKYNRGESNHNVHSWIPAGGHFAIDCLIIKAKINASNSPQKEREIQQKSCWCICLQRSQTNSCCWVDDWPSSGHEQPWSDFGAR